MEQGFFAGDLLEVGCLRFINKLNFAAEKSNHIRFYPFYLSLWTRRENGIAIIFNVYVFDALICSKPKLEHSDLSNKRGGFNKRGVGL